ncbi:TonB-dependent copper receptor [Natronospira bacteriovora]|uniref:TonB-dependent copper receptor n=1 Tax=Natronospira bacteriovora TaxID=3069753 RepID=A0ABU0W900_9GAMM|nr:TonB-dependent copper receptor [Natronospira sp. AB-CW4]MDQ2070379.1 TonB-dependent copper receptor [Natronospira sp. AB-CW4]
MKTYLIAALTGVLACAPVWAETRNETPPEDNGHAHDHSHMLAQAEAMRQALRLDTIVVTAPVMLDPYRLFIDPRQPQVGMPAHDGGAYLKTIPGFSLSRKGGTSGDPALRGLGGSRLNILLDDAQILGGCGGRMDPPTAYVYPEAYERIEVIKGPQSVRYGASSAGVVRFERERSRFHETTTEGYAGFTAGSFGRRDFTAEVTSGGPTGFARLIATTSTQDDYRDGDGEQVHSAYQRWSNTLVLGWTPDSLTHVEFSHDRSDAQAAYDDRGMDGSRFARSGYSLRASRQDINGWLDELEGVLFHNEIDHVMDNYTLRAPPMMPMVSYPDRRTHGLRATATVTPAERWQMDLGVDWMENRHRGNRLMGSDAFTFRDVPREDTAEFLDYGVFLEGERMITPRSRFNMGLRADRSRATALDDDGFGGAEPGSREQSDQHSAFIRYSQDMATRPLTLFVGLGHAERAPDFWERRRVFDLDDESLTQLDLGLQYRGSAVTVNVALFYGLIRDHILIIEPGREDREARNVDASTQGGELDVVYRLSDHWKFNSSLVWLRSSNDSDDRALAQTPPGEITLGLAHENDHYFSGLHLRAVAKQDRIHPGYGTIYGLDSEETPGFAVLSAYAGRHLSDELRLSIGVDNLLDRAYAEHIQRGEAELGALEGRIPEPGRTVWLRLAASF